MLTQTRYTFSKHIRNRASALSSLAPFEHIHTETLAAIARIDWHKSNDLEGIDDRTAARLIKAAKWQQSILAAREIDDDRAATEYMDAIDCQIRRWMQEYEQLEAAHTLELKRLAQSFGQP
jgi:hypothetical protein